MNSVFGIIFSNAAGESAELAIESGTLDIYVRATGDGEWKAWKRVGGIEGTGETAAIVSDAAKKLQTPRRISLGGMYVDFDGSQDVSFAGAMPFAPMPSTAEGVGQIAPGVLKRPAAGAAINAIHVPGDAGGRWVCVERPSYAWYTSGKDGGWSDTYFVGENWSLYDGGTQLSDAIHYGDSNLKFNPGKFWRVG